MFLYSVAIGASCGGGLLILVAASLIRFYFALTGSFFGVFKPGYGYDWTLIFLTVFSIASTAWGLTIIIKHGYLPADPFVALIITVVVFGFGMIVARSLSSVGRRKSPKYRQRVR